MIVIFESGCGEFDKVRKLYLINIRLQFCQRAFYKRSLFENEDFFFFFFFFFFLFPEHW